MCAYASNHKRLAKRVGANTSDWTIFLSFYWLIWRRIRYSRWDAALCSHHFPSFTSSYFTTMNKCFSMMKKSFCGIKISQLVDQYSVCLLSMFSQSVCSSHWATGQHCIINSQEMDPNPPIATQENWPIGWLRVYPFSQSVVMSSIRKHTAISGRAIR